MAEFVSFTKTVEPAHASGSITLSDVPTDGATVTVRDGRPTTATTFRFTSTGVEPDRHRPVPIAGTAQACAVSLKAAIESTALGGRLEITGPEAGVLSIVNRVAGTAGNAALEDTSAVISHVDLAGGVDAAATSSIGYSEPEDADLVISLEDGVLTFTDVDGNPVVTAAADAISMFEGLKRALGLTAA